MVDGGARLATAASIAGNRSDGTTQITKQTTGG
jgi:hypothetical protein